MTDVTLYQAEWCPYSHRVRHMLTNHGVSYRTVNVPAAREDRDELERITGQRSIPTLVVDGQVLTEFSAIGRAVAQHFPVERSVVGAHERQAAPAAAARLDSGDIDELAASLQEAFAPSGFALVQDQIVGPGSVRSYALVHDELNERLVEIEPRLRPMLPLRISLHRHDNGAVATLPLPNQLWMHYHDPELNRESHALTQTIQRALERVGSKSGVA